MPIIPPNNAVGGQIWSWGFIDCGPSIGLVRRPLFNDKYITSGSSYTIQPFDWRLILQLTVPAIFTFNLLPVTTWLRQPYGQFPLNFKDGANNAATFAITIAANGSDLIDGLPSVQIVSDGGSLSVEPKSDLTGWILGP
jgi:hypothetical protein